MRDAIRAKSRELGFDACGFARPDAIPLAAERLNAWLASGAHGEMGWMADRADARGSPQRLWSETRSVVLLGMNYGPGFDPLAATGTADRGAISVYAQGRDYHDVLKGRLKLLAGFMLSRAGGGAVKVFVDTAPVMEKPLAEAAGLGWQGKHTNLVSRGFGSWLFLGAIFTDLELSPDARESDHCGSCRACLDACPTQAFPAPYRLDARRCISYLTIEHKGPIPEEFRAAIGNRVYGCDDCLAVCPWNKFAQAAREAKLAANASLRAPRLADLAALDEAAFRRLFAGSAVKRIGHARFLRNVAIAIGNSGDCALAATLLPLLDAVSPLIRGAAVWALGRLLDADAFSQLVKARLREERDPSVAAEIAKMSHCWKK
ncbi:tRNA epoxyqueuosine(34) reductase QueG [Methylocystis bryophila]|uniref:tRNA epoxyqueuosine(34) reductase QueG n=1 Tax=Methylocystis bryophila TaxID=655015 RepID=UPI00131A2A8C|nr:tRNA epoxyqueuosine(34) reductase QueG [Methylocystis bryophila]BDV38879.1 epoxyqueuosine reductase [Methylocystis bryophila]